jgi:hypothetical protein
MASTSTGITVHFNGAQIFDVIDVKYDYGGGVPTARTFNWKSEMGTVTISSYGLISTGNWGTRGFVVINGGGMGFTNMGVCTSVGGQPQLNGVTKYSMTIKLLAY